jgi:RNA polymerase sigma factor (sigma-70 family)
MVVEVAEARALFEPLSHVTRRQPAAPSARQSSGESADRGTFVAVLFRRHRRQLLWYLLRLTSSRDDAEEIAQEAYLRLLRVDGLESDSVRARNYLFRTATNLVRDNYRRRTARCEQQHVALEDLQLEAEDSALDRIVDSQLAADIVIAILRDVAPRPRQAFLMHFGHGITYEQIATELGVSKKTVERDLVTTLEICRSKLAQWRDG